MVTDEHIQAMWLMFLRAPGKAQPDVDGYFDLQEIGSTKEKDWERLTPYSPTQRTPADIEGMLHKLVDEAARSEKAL